MSDSPKPEFCPRCGQQHDLSLEACPHGEEKVESDEDLEPGTFAGDYRIVRKIGEGGMGAVYEGEHPVIGKRVAIKCLHRRFAKDATAVRRFVDEAWAVNRVGSRHIVDIFGFGTLDDGRQYCVMELLDGRTLKPILEERGPIPFGEIIDIMAQICKGLAVAHDAGIVHRDMKPDNIFLSVDEEDGTPFAHILDFGIAKLTTTSKAFVEAKTTPYAKAAELQGFSGAQRTQAGVVLGTPEYIAPERCTPSGVVDARSDIYALGIMVYQMLTGAPPFLGDNPIAVAALHLNETPAEPTAVVPGRQLGREVDRFIVKALAKAPEDRIQTPRDFIDELKKAAGPLADERTLPAGFGVSVRTFGGGDSLMLATATSDIPPVVPRSRLPALLGIGVALLTAAFITVVVSRSGEDADHARADKAAAAEGSDVKPEEEPSPDEDEKPTDEDAKDDTKDDAKGDADEKPGSDETAPESADPGTAAAGSADEAGKPGDPDAAEGTGPDEGAGDDESTPAGDGAGYRRIRVLSKPGGAAVLLFPDLTTMGVTPLDLDVSTDVEAVWLRLTKRGYRNKDVEVTAGDTMTVTLDKVPKRRPGGSGPLTVPRDDPKIKPKIKPKPKPIKKPGLKTPEWMRK